MIQQNVNLSLNIKDIGDQLFICLKKKAFNKIIFRLSLNEKIDIDALFNKMELKKEQALFIKEIVNPLNNKKNQDFNRNSLCYKMNAEANNYDNELILFDDVVSMVFCYIFEIEQDILISIYDDHIELLFPSDISPDAPLVNQIAETIKECFVEEFNVKDKNLLIMMPASLLGYVLWETKSKLPDFNPIQTTHQKLAEKDLKIKAFLNDKTQNGLIALTGKTGTGKTNYIRSLINNINIPFIYLSYADALYIDDDEISGLFSFQKNGILIIEDGDLLLDSKSFFIMLNTFFNSLSEDASVKKIILTMNQGYTKKRMNQLAESKHLKHHMHFDPI